MTDITNSWIDSYKLNIYPSALKSSMLNRFDMCTCIRSLIARKIQEFVNSSLGHF